LLSGDVVIVVGGVVVFRRLHLWILPGKGDGEVRQERCRIRLRGGTVHQERPDEDGRSPWQVHPPWSWRLADVTREEAVAAVGGAIRKRKCVGGDNDNNITISHKRGGQG